MMDIAAAFGPVGHGFRRLIDWTLPPLCLNCRKPVGDHASLCAGCWGRLTFIEHPLCARLGLPLAVDMGADALSAEALRQPPAFDRARAAFVYDEAGRALITGLKFGDRLHLAKPVGRWMTRAGRDILHDADMLVPVPLHWRRLFSRSYNQAAELARVVSRLSGVSYAPECLTRQKPTRHQIGLDRTARRDNVSEAFRVPDAKAQRLAGRAVVLVDDVLTTGATAEACARVLRRAGARRIDVLTAARVVERAFDAHISA